MSFATSKNLPVNAVLVTDGSGDFVSSATTTAELSRLSGATSSIQTQINGRATTAQVNEKPTIKCMILKGVFPGTSAGFTKAHNIPNGYTVLGFCIGVQYSGAADVTSRLAMPPNFTDSANFHYQAYIADLDLTERQISSSSLRGMPYKCVIWYN